jgi:hypothetical protein
MNKEKTVRYNENVNTEGDDDNERRNVCKLASRRYNFASLLCAP